MKISVKLLLDQTKLSRVPLCIGYCNLCMECHRKLHL